MLSNVKGLLSIYLQCNVKKCKITSQANIILATSITISPTVFAIFVLITPCISFIFPCLYENHVYTYLFGRCQSFQFRVFVYGQSVISLVPIGLICPVTIVVAFAAINEITDSLNCLNNWIKRIVTTNPSSHQVAICYRQIQLFVILCNKCYKIYLWPVVEFVSASGSITLLYTLLVLDSVLSGLIKIAIVSFIAAIFCSTFTPLFVGNHSLQLSKVVIAKLKHNQFLIQNDRACIRKFSKSCAPIALKVGGFHEMDKERTPNLMRFILQRTFFLVFKTKQDSNLTISY